GEDAEREHERNDDPGGLEQRRIAFDVAADLVRRLSVVAHHEVENETRDERGEQNRHAERGEEQEIDVPRHLARAGRKKRRVAQEASPRLHHDALLAARLSRMIKTATSAPRDSTVTAPPARIAPRATRVYRPVATS